jgi:indolepyruvate ferredoxin oxidoreductase beta subunit
VDGILAMIENMAGKIVSMDANGLAEEAGNPLSLNMVMLGALIGSDTIPISADQMKDTISSSTKKAFLEYNLKAFDLGMKAAGG